MKLRACSSILVLGLYVFLAGCGGEKAPAPSGEGAVTAPAEPLYLVEKDLEGRDAQVIRQLREREAWHRRLLPEVAGQPARAAEVWGELGNLYQAYGYADPARRCYQQARRLAPEEPRWAYYLGRVEFGQDRLEVSLESLQAAEAIEARRQAAKPGDPAFAKEAAVTLVRLGEVLRDLNRPQEAEARLRKAVELDPENAVARFYLGELAASAGRFDEAVEHFRAALALQPEARAVHYPLGLALRNLGQEEEARRLLAGESEGGGEGTLEEVTLEEVTLDDERTRHLWGLADGQRLFQQRGQELFAAGRHQEALAAFQRAVAADPLFSLPRLNLATALLRLDQVEAAEEQLHRALQLAPEAPQGHRLLGQIRYRQGRYGEAADSLGRAVAGALDAERAEIRLQLGLALEAAGRPEEALAAYRQALDAEPRLTAAWLGEASALLHLGRHGEARRRLEAGLEVIERSGELSQALARVLAAAPEPEVRDGRRALEIAQGLFDARQSPDHAETLALALAQEGRFEDAARLQEQLIAGARSAGREALAERYRRCLNEYQAGRPCREPWK